MKTLLSDSLRAPRYVDASSVKYQYPITPTGTETLPTRNRIDGYRSMPIPVSTRNLEIVWTLRSPNNRVGIVSLYVWKQPAPIQYKQTGRLPAVYLMNLGKSWFGEVEVVSGSSVGTIQRAVVRLDEDVTFVQLYMTQDATSVAVREADPATADATVVTLYPPMSTDDILVIADDFELQQAGSVVTLIGDTFELGGTQNPSYGW